MPPSQVPVTSPAPSLIVAPDAPPTPVGEDAAYAAELAAINGEGDDDEDTSLSAGMAPGSVDISQLANAIVQAVNAAQGPRKIFAAEYQRTRSIHRDKPQLTRKIYQNGIMLTRNQLTADAINLCNAIQPGLYADGALSVVALREGTTGVSLDIRYSNKSADERMLIKSLFPTFAHMLATIVREQQQRLVTA